MIKARKYYPEVEFPTGNTVQLKAYNVEPSKHLKGYIVSTGFGVDIPDDYYGVAYLNNNTVVLLNQFHNQKELKFFFENSITIGEELGTLIVSPKPQIFFDEIFNF